MLQNPLQVTILPNRQIEPIQKDMREAAFEYLDTIGFVKKVEGESGAYYKLTHTGLKFLEKYPGIELRILQEKGLVALPDGHIARENDLRMFVEWPSVQWQASNPHVTVLIPTRNEAETIGELAGRLPQVLRDSYQLLVVDASDDATPWVAMFEGARVMRQYGRGKGNALRQILPAIESNIVLMMDGDGSMRPEEIPRFVQAIESGADIVKGSRFIREGGSLDMSLIRRIGNLFFVVLVNLLWSAKYTDLCYGFMAFKKDALKKLAPHLRSDGFEIETEICIKARNFGLSVCEVPSLELNRKSGNGKLRTTHDGIRILKTIMQELIGSRSRTNRVLASFPS